MSGQQLAECAPSLQLLLREISTSFRISILWLPLSLSRSAVTHDVNVSLDRWIVRISPLRAALTRQFRTTLSFFLSLHRNWIFFGGLVHIECYGPNTRSPNEINSIRDCRLFFCPVGLSLSCLCVRSQRERQMYQISFVCLCLATKHDALDAVDTSTSGEIHKDWIENNRAKRV